MGRPRKTDRSFPPRFYKRRKSYFYASPDGPWVNLGRDLHRALSEYHRITSTTPDGRPVTIAALLEWGVERARDKGLAAYTIKDYERWSRRLSAVFGHLHPDSLTRDDVVRYCDLRCQSSVRQAEGEYGFLRFCYRAAHRRGWVQAIVPDLVDPEDRPRSKRRTHLPDPKDIEFFISVAPARLSAYVKLKRLVALRQSDILFLRTEHITDEGLLAFVHKTRRALLFAWTEELRSVVDEILALPRKQGWLFERSGSRPYLDFDDNGGYVVCDGWHTMWQKAMRKAVRDHGITRFIDSDLRAEAATTVYQERGFEEAFRLLAHDQRSTTERYVRDRLVQKVEPVSRKRRPGHGRPCPRG